MKKSSLVQVTLEAALRSCNCGPRKLHLDQPWLWLMGDFIKHHTLQWSSVHLCWLQWYLRDDIVSRTPVLLRLVHEKLELVGRMDLEPCEQAQLDHLRMRVRAPIILLFFK